MLRALVTNQHALHWIFVRVTSNGLTVSMRQFSCLFLAPYDNCLLIYNCIVSLQINSPSTISFETMRVKTFKKQKDSFGFNRDRDSRVDIEWFIIRIETNIWKKGAQLTKLPIFLFKIIVLTTFLPLKMKYNMTRLQELFWWKPQQSQRGTKSHFWFNM